MYRLSLINVLNQDGAICVLRVQEKNMATNPDWMYVCIRGVYVNVHDK
jgi:hypothetical protein